MRERVCNNCGGKKYIIVGQNTVKCSFCGTIYVDEVASQEQEVLTVNAYQKLRDYKFTEALKLFDKIIAQFPMSYEAYYGRFQAKNKVLYYSSNDGMGNSPLKKYPVFFGKEIPVYEDDEDYKKALELAPDAVKANYTENAEIAKHIHDDYLAIEQANKKCDVFLNITANSEKGKELHDLLEKDGVSVFLREDAKRSKFNTEAYFYYAIKYSKVQLVIVEDETFLNTPKFMSLADRFWYRINHKERFPSSFIVLYDEKKISKDEIKKYFPKTEVFFTFSEPDLNQKLIKTVKEAVERAYNEDVVLEKKKIEKVEPAKKKAVEIHTITPTELGRYNVENVPMSDKNKLKWIFYSIKNGDFNTAEELLNSPEYIDSKLGEVEFARILCEKKLKSEDEFFQNIKNIVSVERLEEIIKNSSADFANDIVNKWEELVIKSKNEEVYKNNILFLAQYQNSGRANFLNAAENIALETLDQDLIDKLLQCFSASDVDSYVNFYFQLAQKTGDDSYYEKVLNLDEGHMPSRFALFIKNFGTVEQKLNYRDGEALKNILQFCDETQASNFLFSICDMVVSVAYENIVAAEQQFDFYLSYISNNEILKSTLINISAKLQEMRLFSLAEKYLVLAIKEDPQNAELYWKLIQIKTHCRNESELVTTSVKIADMDDWATVLNYATEAQAEKYAQVISSSNLSTSQKVFREEIYDKSNLIHRLSEFLLRNNSLLKEYEDKGLANYYKLQLTAFDIYFPQLEKAKTYDEYMQVYDRIFERMELLDVTLDTSLDVTKFIKKKESVKVLKSQEKHRDRKYLSEEQVEERTSRWKKLLFLSLIVVPMALITLYLVLIFMFPQDMYQTFKQRSVFFAVAIALVIGIGGIIYNRVRKHKTLLRWRLLRMLIFAVSVVDLVLTILMLYVFPATISISSAKEFYAVLHNTSYVNVELKDDIDLNGYNWNSTQYYGKLDGNGHTIFNLKLTGNGGERGFFSQFSGTVRDLNFVVDATGLNDVDVFGILAAEAKGTISNVNISAKSEDDVISVSSINPDAAIGGLVGTMKDGEISNCFVDVKLNVIATGANVGGLVGEVDSSKVEIFASRAKIDGELFLDNSTFGGLVGVVSNKNSTISECYAEINLNIKKRSEATTTLGNIGGFAGLARIDISDCYSTGSITLENVDAMLGGFVGVFNGAGNLTTISHIYSNVAIQKDGEDEAAYKYGVIVGRLVSGIIRNCLGVGTGTAYGVKDAAASFPNVVIVSSFEEVNELNEWLVGLSKDKWQTEDGKAPTLLVFG